MGENCISSVIFMNDIMEDFRCLVSDMIDDGYDYEEALEKAWPWVKPAKKRAYVASKHMLAKHTQETPNE